MVRLKVAFVTLPILAVATVGASAGDVWNILDPAVSASSRETSAKILDSAAEVFQALAQAERENKLSRDRFFNAADRLESAAHELDSLADTSFAKQIFPQNSDTAQTVMQWYTRLNGIERVEQPTVGDVLKAAAVECRTLAVLLREKFGKEDFPDPVRTFQVVSEYAQFIQVGALAADTFSRMKE